MIHYMCSSPFIAGCVQGVLPAETVSLYGPSSRNIDLSFISKGALYVFPSMTFSCDGTITDIRMRLRFAQGLSANSDLSQEVVVYFLLFHDGLNSPTRRVTHILLNQTNTQQEFPNEIWTNRDPLSLPVTEGSYIGFAVPENSSSTTVTKPITLLPTLVTGRVETFRYDRLQYYWLIAPFSSFKGRVLKAARTADSSQFTTLMVNLPLIDVSFSEWLLSTIYAD